MQKILISSCLLGNKVRYDGQSKTIAHPQLRTWQDENRLVVLCPEIAGGLTVPRTKAELLEQQVIDESGNNVTQQFVQGALQALSLCQKQQIKFALLKEFSPSCGATTIYNGQFQGIKIAGMGVTAKLLTEHGIRVFSEFSIDALATAIKEYQ